MKAQMYVRNTLLSLLIGQYYNIQWVGITLLKSIQMEQKVGGGRTVLYLIFFAKEKE